jgi:hypothetical protein
VPCKLCSCLFYATACFGRRSSSTFHTRLSTFSLSLSPLSTLDPLPLSTSLVRQPSTWPQPTTSAFAQAAIATTRLAHCSAPNANRKIEPATSAVKTVSNATGYVSPCPPRPTSTATNTPIRLSTRSYTRPRVQTPSATSLLLESFLNQTQQPLSTTLFPPSNTRAVSVPSTP